ncbi:hypothetical protein ASZ90_019374 [hydrocarbon metagenome]|uniref:Uncharacterized protein n=1 Tax=hydrocarbon metagenome TaxID=938273 RepID=A0A0W8E3S3_9ZZZZ
MQELTSLRRESILAFFISDVFIWSSAESWYTITEYMHPVIKIIASHVRYILRLFKGPTSPEFINLKSDQVSLLFIYYRFRGKKGEIFFALLIILILNLG